MKSLLASALTLAFFAAFGLGILYVGARLRTLFGLASRWPLTVGLALAITGALLAVGLTTRATSAAAGWLNVLGGHVLALCLFTLLGLLCLHALQLVWRPPPQGSGVAVLVLALATTAIGALRAAGFSVHERDIPLPGLAQTVTVMQILDVHLGHTAAGRRARKERAITKDDGDHRLAQIGSVERGGDDLRTDAGRIAEGDANAGEGECHGDLEEKESGVGQRMIILCEVSS